MVELNIGRQPQDTENQDHLEESKQACNRFVHHRQVNTVEEVLHRIRKIEEFKQEVSKDLIDLCQRTDTLKNKFRKFVTQEDLQYADLPLLANRADFYANLLTVQTRQIFDGLDADLNVWTNFLK